MSDASARTAGAGLDGIWADLASWGYALTDNETIGLPEKFCENFGQRYFNDLMLHHDARDLPLDRQRARDVVLYRWCDDDPLLEEHDTITITNRAGIVGKRDHSRVWLLKDTLATQMICTFLRLVPPSQRQHPEGTFGVNLFRTFTNVVTRPHHDHEQFVILFVVGRVGSGAETYLYHPADVPEEGEPTAKPVLRHQLSPGEIIIFEDKRFKHGTTPLEAPPGGTAMRDAVVCTVDYPETYLAARVVR